MEPLAQRNTLTRREAVITALVSATAGLAAVTAPGVRNEAIGRETLRPPPLPTTPFVLSF